LDFWIENKPSGNRRTTGIDRFPSSIFFSRAPFGNFRSKKMVWQISDALVQLDLRQWAHSINLFLDLAIIFIEHAQIQYKIYGLKTLLQYSKNQKTYNLSGIRTRDLAF
jgi:hypothetical protein